MLGLEQLEDRIVAAEARLDKLEGKVNHGTGVEVEPIVVPAEPSGSIVTVVSEHDNHIVTSKPGPDAEPKPATPLTPGV